jgi:hypothetical protein
VFAYERYAVEERKLRTKAVEELRKHETRMFGSVKDFDKNIFREDSRPSRWQRPKIKMIRQGNKVEEPEKDKNLLVLTRKAESISQEYEEMNRQQLFIQQDIEQRHGEITAQKNDKALFDLAVEQIKTYERKIEQLQGFYERQKELTQDAVEELKARRVRIGEIAAEALQEAQQKRAGAKANQEAQTSSQTGSIQPMQVDATSTKKNKRGTT